VRSCCCSLETSVVIVGILQSLVYSLLGFASTAWFVLQNSQEQTGTKVQEVNSMEAVEWSLELEERPTLPLTPRLLGVCLALAVFGLLTAILLLIGVRTSIRMLFLPWLIFNVLVIISLLAAGLYLIIRFSLLLDEPDYLRAALSSPLVLLGIFLIFIWVLVDQLFLALGHRKLLVRVASSFRGSRASLTSRHRTGGETPGSMRSLSSSHRPRSLSSSQPRSLGREPSRSGRSHPGRRGGSAPRSAPSRRRRDTQGVRVREFSCRLDLPGSRSQGALSRSLEQILGSSSGEESSVYSRQAAIASLPRLRKSRHQPGMFQAEFQQQESSENFEAERASTDRLARRDVRGGSMGTMVDTDTMRSSRSLASAKSVTIDPEVTEYHYRGRQEGYHNPVAEEGLEESEGGVTGRVLEGREDAGPWREEVQPVGEGQQKALVEAEEGQREAAEGVPAPVYPTLDWRERRRGLTRDQIIDYYCQPGDAAL